MKKRSLMILMTLLSMGFLFGCEEKAGPIEGTWYEQTASNADTIEIKGGRLTYRYGFEADDNVAYKGGFKLTEEGARTRIVLDKGADFYEDLYYDAENDIITAELFAADYGTVANEFRRTVYEAPPEPVYGERIDETDPDAVKEILWERIVSAEVSFFESVDYRGYTMNTAFLPRTGSYAYSIRVEDGRVLVSSDFYSEEVTLSGEAVDLLKDYADRFSLAELNGLNIHTQDVPESASGYTIRLMYDDGTSFYSSANWKDVPANWDTFMRLGNEVLYEAFIDAGYDPYS